MTSSHQEQDITVGIIGGGISGIILGLALSSRSIPFIIYEQSSSMSSTGAGLNCNPTGLVALRACSEDASQAWKKVKVSHWPGAEELYFVYTDGERSFEVTCKGEFGAVHRVSFMQALTSRLPESCMRFGKRLESIAESNDGRAVMRFEDGSEELADVVVGCDGVRSRVRRFVVGPDHPSAMPGFSQVVAYRGMISREQASAVLGPELTAGSIIHINFGECYVSYPITGGELLSFGLFKPYPGPWPYLPSLAHSEDKSALIASMDSSSATFKKLATLLPDKLDCWAIFDTADNPLPRYSNGKVTVVGDAAHASTPNLGAGAGQGFEDVAVLSALIRDVKEASSRSNAAGAPTRKQRILAALSGYSRARMVRSQKTVTDSRYIGNCFNGTAYGQSDIERVERDVRLANDYIWYDTTIEEQIIKAREYVQDELNFHVAVKPMGFDDIKKPRA